MRIADLRHQSHHRGVNAFTCLRADWSGQLPGDSDRKRRYWKHDLCARSDPERHFHNRTGCAPRKCRWITHAGRDSFSFAAGFNTSGQAPLAVDPKGRWVFALVADSNNQQQLVSIARNADGSLGNVGNAASIFNQKCNSNPVLPNIAIDPQGKNLFISCNPLGAATFEGIQVYGINQTTGVPQRINSFATQHLFEALSSDRQGWRVFAVSEETNLIEPLDFNRNVDAIQLLNGGILYHTGSQPNGVAVDPANKFVYVTNGSFCFPKQIANGNCTNSSSGNISGYAFNYTQGTLTNLAGSPFPSGAGTRSMIFVQVP